MENDKCFNYIYTLTRPVHMQQFAKDLTIQRLFLAYTKSRPIEGGVLLYICFFLLLLSLFVLKVKALIVLVLTMRPGI